MPAPDTVRKLLKRFHKTDIQRSWFFQCCKDLERDGYITRHVRYVYPPGPEIRQRPSEWIFTLKGAEYLKANKVEGAAEMVEAMIEWLKLKDNRWPTVKNIIPQEPLTSREEAIEKLQEIIKGMGNHQRKTTNIINGVRNG